MPSGSEAYLGRGRKNVITDSHDTLHYFSELREVAAYRYREFVRSGLGQKSPLEGVKGSILGSEFFRRKVINYLKETTNQTEIPEIRKIMVKGEVENIVKTVANYYEIKQEDLLIRKRATERQRKIAMYLSKILSGKKNVEVGKVFGVTIQAVTNAVRDVEKIRREDSKLNREIFLIKKIIEQCSV